MNTYKNLINNSFAFALGNFGSKLISLLLLPLYTFYLSTTEFGIVDLVITTLAILLPTISLSIFDSVLRFVKDEKEDKNVILSNSLFVGFLGFIFIGLFYPLLKYFQVFDGYLGFLYTILFLQNIQRTLGYYTKAIGEVKIYAINGIILTLCTGLLNIFFLVVLNLGVNGYFLSMVFAYLISIIYLLTVTDSLRSFKVHYFDSNVIMRLIHYSIPMVPNSLMWWLINGSSHFFIVFYLGISANGIFGVATKIPAVINIFNQIFIQAWQLSAIEEYKSKNKSQIYSNVFQHLFSLMFILVSSILLFLKPTFSIVFGAEFFIAWRAVPFLLIGAVFSSFSSFLGASYMAAKETKGVFNTSLYGGIVGLVLNILLIPLIGIVGAGISSMLSFLVMFLVRYFDTKKYVNIIVNWRLFIVNLIILIIQTALLFLNYNQISSTVIQLVLFLLLLFINRIIIYSLKKVSFN